MGTPRRSRCSIPRGRRDSRGRRDQPPHGPAALRRIRRHPEVIHAPGRLEGERGTSDANRDQGTRRGHASNVGAGIAGSDGDQGERKAAAGTARETSGTGRGARRRHPSRRGARPSIGRHKEAESSSPGRPAHHPHPGPRSGKYASWGHCASYARTTHGVRVLRISCVPRTPPTPMMRHGALRCSQPHAHCIGKRSRTMQGESLRSVSGPAVHSRYRRQPMHGVQATRWFAPAARTRVTAPKEMHRDGTMRAGTAAPWPRLSTGQAGGRPDWGTCEGGFAAQGRCGEEQKASPAPQSAERANCVEKSTQKQWRVPVSGLCEPVSRVAD